MTLVSTDRISAAADVFVRHSTAAARSRARSSPQVRAGLLLGTGTGVSADA